MAAHADEKARKGGTCNKAATHPDLNRYEAGQAECQHIHNSSSIGSVNSSRIFSLKERDFQAS